MDSFPVIHGTIDEHSVKAVGAKIIGDGAGISINGWTITSDKAPIAGKTSPPTNIAHSHTSPPHHHSNSLSLALNPNTGDQDLESLKSQLAAPNLPEQVYSRNILSLSHLPSGFHLTFTAKDALHSWIHDDSAPVHVKAARSWQETRRDEMKAQNAKVLDYDWTFTTKYEGSSPVPWTSISESPDRSALLAREPILLWDEVPLYESELEDNGASQLRVKIRVMPSCWLVLMRYYLRVDGMIVRLRETRYFTRWDDDDQAGQVFKEVKWHEGTPSSMKHWGLCMEHHHHHHGERGGGKNTSSSSVWNDGDSAANALQAVAPSGVVKYELYSLKL